MSSNIHLSPLADTILNHVSNNNRYPTPVSPKRVSTPLHTNSSRASQSVPSVQQNQKFNPVAHVVIPAKYASSTSQPTQNTTPRRYPFPDPPQGYRTQQHLPVTCPQNEIIHDQSAFTQNQGIASKDIHNHSQSSARLVAKAVQVPVPDTISKVKGHFTPASQAPTPLMVSPTHKISSLNRSTPQPLVVIPLSSAEARKSDFVTHNMSLSGVVSRKRKRGFGDESAIQIPETKDQRAVADAAFQQFSEILEDIFEADNQSPPSPEFFMVVPLDDRDTSTLAPAILVKLESSLQKIISLGRLSEISFEDLQRLQGLCEGAISSAESEDFRFDTDWYPQEFDSWIRRLDFADLALRSARIILRTMTGGREEQHLNSEELLLSILRVVQKIADSCIVPVVEARSSCSPNLVQNLSVHRKSLSQILHDVDKVMVLLAKLLTKEDMSESVIIPIEFFGVRLVFVENASSEKESILGTQKYESIRRTAMDTIAIIFSRYPPQRAFLFDEILTSLQRLPTGRQAARHFRLSNGRAIQLVTALIIQLVQTSATVARPAGRKKPTIAPRPSHKGAQDATPNGISEQDSGEEHELSDDSTGSNKKLSNPLRRLRHIITPLCDSAAKSAQHAVGYLMQRAQTSSKSGDEPHRQLLDIFVEDLLMVLGLPEWPGAEILLRAVCARASHIFENTKSLAPAKNMALELLGTMGSAISDLVANTRTMIKGLDNQDAEYSGYLRQMFEDYADGSLEGGEILMWDGPYHAVVEYLESNASEDLQILSAQAYYLAQWAKSISVPTLKPTPDSDKLAVRLSTMLSGEEWVTSEALGHITVNQSNVAYALTVLNMDFCRRFDYILRILLDSVTSEQTTVRSRGLKSVTQMLERDPSILDRARSVKNIILKCATDTSPLVRDAALTLIGKCIALKPTLEGDFLNHILHLSNDAAVGVRKRSLKLLKDIYLQNTTQNNRIAISDSLLQRVKDPDGGVADLARQIFEDIWITPFAMMGEASNSTAQDEILLRSQVLLIIRTVSRSTTLPPTLVLLLKDILSKKSKNAALNFKVCQAFVCTAFDVMIDSTQIAEAPAQSHILETLTIFAKADPQLFASDQLQILQPYIGNISSLNDLNIFRPVVVIFRCVLPVRSSVEYGLLEAIQTALLKSVSKLSKNELDEVAECLWIINCTIRKPEPLIKLIVSVLKNLHGLEKVSFMDAASKDNLLRAKKYIHIAGYFGKHCDFENYATTFQSVLPWFKSGSVANSIVCSLLPFSAASQPLTLRAVAFDGIGLICQSWPFVFTQPVISKSFANILQHGEQDLQEIVLSHFRDFFANSENQAAPKTEDGESQPPSSSKLGVSMTASERDSASALITQHFLQDILGIALTSQDMSALTATEVIASINRQGLAHPKESGPALVALETSTNAAIAKVALEEHRILHQQHESMFEREYMRAIHAAFRYQKDVVKDPLGFTAQPLIAKLNGTWDIIKTSKAKYQKKFLSNYCSKIDFDPSKLDNLDEASETLLFSRFLTENIAFFDYTRLDELLHAISCMEKIVAATGSGVSHSISTEVFHIVVEADIQDDQHANAVVFTNGADPNTPLLPQNSNTDTKPPIDFARLKQLTTAAVILSSLWEARTFLRRLYGQTSNQQRRESGRGRPATKDLSKAPTRVQGVPGEKLVAAIADKVASLNSEATMVKQCEEFVELLSIDSEVKVNTESEESFGERPGTPDWNDDDERDTPMSNASRGVKRKTPVSATGTPSKKRGRPPLGRRKSSHKSIDLEESDGEWQ